MTHPVNGLMGVSGYTDYPAIGDPTPQRLLPPKIPPTKYQRRVKHEVPGANWIGHKPPLSNGLVRVTSAGTSVQKPDTSDITRICDSIRAFAKEYGYATMDFRLQSPVGVVTWGGQPHPAIARTGYDHEARMYEARMAQRREDLYNDFMEAWRARGSTMPDLIQQVQKEDCGVQWLRATRGMTKVERRVFAKGVRDGSIVWPPKE